MERWHVRRLKSLMAHAFTIISDIPVFSWYCSKYKRQSWFILASLVMHAHLGMDEKKKMRRKLIRFASRCSICASTIPYCNKHLLLFLFLKTCLYAAIIIIYFSFWQWYWQLKVNIWRHKGLCSFYQIDIIKEQHNLLSVLNVYTVTNICLMQ